MTVKELIELLQIRPPDMRVMVDGYEEGLKDITPLQVRTVSVELDYYNNAPYSGKHRECQEWDDVADYETPPIEALVVSRHDC